MKVNVEKKRLEEKETLKVMIHLYCKRRCHTKKGELCEKCRELEEYAVMRTEKCPFMETKTFCSACKIHCYSDEMQEKIQKVMKFAGPRMLLINPVKAIKHLKITIKEKRGKKCVS